MPFVYHLKPKNLVGNVLYPLNQLREHFPEIYEQHVLKYEGREKMLSRYIPLLDCLWNDVLFFSSIHPRVIQAAFLDVGKNWSPAQWYEIDPMVLGFNAQNTVIYEPDIQREKGDYTLSPARVMPFETGRLKRLDKMPQANLDYYRDATQRNERIMIWRGLTHILHKGSISLKNARLFEL